MHTFELFASRFRGGGYDRRRRPKTRSRALTCVRRRRDDAAGLMKLERRDACAGP